MEKKLIGYIKNFQLSDLLGFARIVGAEETEDLAPNAKSAIMIEASTGEILFQKNANEKLAPASMTKMMSMLLIMEEIEKGNLKYDEEITASENASSMGGSQIFLQAGEKMTVTDSAYAGTQRG